jgi:hypothetical protein
VVEHLWLFIIESYYIESFGDGEEGSSQSSNFTNIYYITIYDYLHYLSRSKRTLPGLMV